MNKQQLVLGIVFGKQHSVVVIVHIHHHLLTQLFAHPPEAAQLRLTPITKLAITTNKPGKDSHSSWRWEQYGHFGAAVCDAAAFARAQ